MLVDDLLTSEVNGKFAWGLKTEIARKHGIVG